MRSPACSSIGPGRAGSDMLIAVEGNLEAALRQLKKALHRAGTLYEVRARASFRPKSERRRLKSRRAQKRARRALVTGKP